MAWPLTIDVLLTTVVTALALVLPVLRRRAARARQRPGAPVRLAPPGARGTAWLDYRASVVAVGVCGLVVILLNAIAPAPIIVICLTVIMVVMDTLLYLGTRSLLVAGAVSRPRGSTRRALRRRERLARWRRAVAAVLPRLRYGYARLVWASPAVLVIAGTVAMGALAWPHLPARLPIHYNLDSDPDASVHKSISTAFAVVLAQIVLTGLMAGIAHAAGRAGTTRRPASRADAVISWYSTTMSRAVMIAAACVNLSLLFAARQLWYGTSASLRDNLGMAVLFGVAGTVAILGGGYHRFHRAVSVPSRPPAWLMAVAVLVVVVLGFSLT